MNEWTFTRVWYFFSLFFVWIVSSQPGVHAFDESFQLIAPHHVMRRSAQNPSASSLKAVFTPVIHNVAYYNIGDIISFNMSLTHNQSASVKVPDTSLKITLISELLLPNRASLNVVTGQSLTNVASNDSALYFEIGTLGASEELSVTFNATVKASIYPLANLYFALHVTGQDSGNAEYSYGPVPSLPTLYAVFPKVTLSRTSYEDMWVQSTARYVMHITMPHLNFNLLVELSSAINDFSFMEIHDVTVNAQGSNIGTGPGGNLNPAPKYEKSEGMDFPDRVILMFGNLTVAGPDESKNNIEIGYNVTIRDHPELFNGSKHWVGAGMRSGYQMLWVGQEAMYIYKNEPTLTGVVTTVNDTVTRYFIGDEVTVDWYVNHTNNSYDDASDVRLAFNYSAFELVLGTYQKSGNATQSFPANGQISIGPLQQGEYVIGSLTLKVTENISPLENLDIFMRLSYNNIKGDPKMSTVHKPVPPYVAGVPGFSLKLNSSTNHIVVGGRATFFFEVSLWRMKSPLKIEIILPVNQTSIMALTYVKIVSVGNNIINNNALKETALTLNSTVGNPELFDRATIDFGTVKSINGNEGSPANAIVVEFEIVVNDHLNVTNGSKHWVAVGVRGGEHMIWVGERALVAEVPDYRRPVLKVTANCFVPGTQDSCEMSSRQLNRGDKVYYNGSVEHVLMESQRYAENVKLFWMIPPYVKYEAVLNKDKLHHESTEGGQMFKFDKTFHFKDRLSFSFMAALDPQNEMPSGNAYAVSPIQLSYAAYRNAHAFGAPLVPVSFSFKVPDSKSSLRAASHLSEVYKRGFLLDKQNNHLFLCQLSEDSVTSSCFFTVDNGDSWSAMDLQLGCIIGQAGGILYGISRNRRAYMKQDARNKAWSAITASAWNEAKGSDSNIADGLVKEGNGNVLPKVANNGAAWKADETGLYVKPPGASFVLKAKWKCCG